MCIKCRGIWIVLISLSYVLVIGCKTKEIKIIEEKYENGKPKTERIYLHDGNKRTLIKELQYYQSGILKLEGEYENNQKNGAWIFYYETGEVWSEGYFKEGLRTGKSIVYHENGQLFYEGEYLKGQKQGNWKFYDQDGNLVNNVQFDPVKMDEDNRKDSSLIEQ